MFYNEGKTIFKGEIYMFNKRSKKVKQMIDEAIEARDIQKMLDIMKAENEGWKQGFKAGYTVAIVGAVTGLTISALIDKALKQ